MIQPRDPFRHLSCIPPCPTEHNFTPCFSLPLGLFGSCRSLCRNFPTISGSVSKSHTNLERLQSPKAGILMLWICQPPQPHSPLKEKSTQNWGGTAFYGCVKPWGNPERVPVRGLAGVFRGHIWRRESAQDSQVSPDSWRVLSPKSLQAPPSHTLSFPWERVSSTAFSGHWETQRQGLREAWLIFIPPVTCAPTGGREGIKMVKERRHKRGGG